MLPLFRLQYDAAEKRTIDAQHSGRTLYNKGSGSFTKSIKHNEYWLAKVGGSEHSTKTPWFKYIAKAVSKADYSVGCVVGRTHPIICEIITTMIPRT